MKRIIFSAIAVVMAVAFSAFTIPAKKGGNTTTYTFAFVFANYSQTLANVQCDVAWKEDATINCPINSNQKPCAIQVDQANTHLDGGVRKLNSGISIVAARFGTTSNYYVSGGADVLSKQNQPL
jgi:hypothetical protein